MHVKNSHPGFVYLVQEAFAGLIKIGYTTQFQKRMEAIKTHNPHALYVKKFIGSPKLEKALHAEFNKKRMSGEWFNLSKEDVMRAEQIIAQWQEKNKGEFKLVHKLRYDGLNKFAKEIGEEPDTAFKLLSTGDYGCLEKYASFMLRRHKARYANRGKQTPISTKLIGAETLI